MATNSTGPHEFKSLGRFFHRKKCRTCYLTKDRHPVTGWTHARPLGDKRLHPLLEPNKDRV